MFDMVRNSVGLFFRGKLFAEPLKAYTQLAFGVLLTAVLLAALYRYGDQPLWISAAIASFVGGALQPCLFRNLRYR